MKVLIADFDLFSKVGGGQTFYRSIIQKNPQIDFYYLAQDEPIERERPANARAISYQARFFLSDFNNFFDVTPPKWIYRSFVRATNIATSVAGQQFDVVDVPDYEQWGVLLRPALQHHGVTFDRLALSMHGNISTTLRLDWFVRGRSNLALELEEKMQYQTVDFRYAISKSYLDEWQEITHLEGHYLNPLHFIDLPKPTGSFPSHQAPSLNFIGRTEKRKGPDIFVDLVWWLPRSSYSRASIIGPHSYDDTGSQCSTDYLKPMLANRLPAIALEPPLNRAELAQRFASQSVTFLPSRYDTLNLLALESLFSGCPTAIGTGAGACRFLEETFPQVPFIKIDLEEIYACLPELCAVLDNYEEYRQKLVDSLLAVRPEVSDPPLESIYRDSPCQWDREVREQLERWYSQLIAFAEAMEAAGGLLNSPAARQLKTQLKPTYQQLKRQVKQGWQTLKGTLQKPLEDTNTAQAIKSPWLVGEYRAIFNAPEQTEKDLKFKVKQCWNVGETQDAELKGFRAKLKSGYRIDRVRLWREIARVEELRGNDLVAATYKLRAMRLLGGDRFGDLPVVLRVLDGGGFSREARAVEAIYSPPGERERRCRELLERAFQDNRHNPERGCELVDDRRDKSSYRASVIVSLYNAAAKLPLFLKTLQHQTLIQAGEAEVILVDSGSPGDEYAVFQQLAPDLNVPLLYLRSQQRETIQSAWNRGIAASRSPYLAFLGVDETILPHCLEVLAVELDRDPSLDWAIGHSLVTEVDRQGSWVRDVMTYDRSGYHQDLVYLETCYLSWVGALYRRSIHDRFGYYDASFRGAGDTEFKSRILPYIKTKAVDSTLGVFWNYPDERTTQSPLAEIEDLRAWYLHRTPAGIDYAFANRHPEEAEPLLRSALSYRKSYCTHTSTDVEYACHLSRFLRERQPNSPLLKYAGGIERLLGAYRALDWIPKLSRLSPLSAIRETQQSASQIEREHQELSSSEGTVPFQPAYQIFNDNRHEQHAFLWLTNIEGMA